ncbi:hypothetical protein MJO28_006584 [Puccinia striiformis f. sp. tritici]|uniref:HhH-GPD domain-containing protein n=2 Tax=Puccinia striiformis f. sp. tritici TaxID=168172 RepID=A0A0L0VV30_9BASI|nr:hypothetical protein Pst134EA_011783 [Puccinia striiformis f. sp. tritici]KAI9629325.1 hypothetical protein KEM48_013072 [Puccinia striiformis f. sp. tritici PST-130]KNF03133.1 hypothetical protein PSTG_03718 [Puccinia striiformis f. sp. tritici PST-78]KAH9468162.1 hypothetical protein Pst134EA_011783 [Puccinia striiformis f. sp. tritici]KAI7954037.1 hypothetical protein MJO28_006584 [Puccinia striiformis f. sp. tritici]KAI7958331.1 hypothetical protein MJO29_006548 [Puccinia striiformis f.
MAQTNGEADSILPVNHRHHEASEPSGSGKDAKPDTAHSRQFTSKPTISDCQQVCSLLAEVEGGFPVRPTRLMGATEEDEQKGSLGGSIARECGEVDEVLDSLVRTILSQHTSQANSIRAKQALDKHFGTGNYQAIRIATVPSISSILQNARVGLAVKKSNAIHELLNHIYLNLNPNLSLEFIRYLPDSEAMDVLTSFKGVGAKTASCVMLFCLGRNFFPVDTHVFRITKALAWIPPTSTRESAFKHLNQTVPDDLKYPLHILLFKHAQHCSICKRINTSQNHNQSTLPSPSHKIGVLSRKNLSHKKASKAKALCPLQALFLWN